MHELLIAILILFISVAMFLSIVFILTVDKKVLTLNEQVNTVKNTDLKQFKSTVAFVHDMNDKINLAQIRRIFDITMVGISFVQAALVCKKIVQKYSTKKP